MSNSGNGTRRTFEEHVKHWVQVDNQLKKLNDHVKVLRDERNQTEESIFVYVHDNKLSTATIAISDGHLRFVNAKHTAPLTLKFVENCLKNTLQNQSEVASVMRTLKESRESKVIPDIKRSYTTNSSN